jgi:hypothetical protein
MQSQDIIDPVDPYLLDEKPFKSVKDKVNTKEKPGDLQFLADTPEYPEY